MVHRLFEDLIELASLGVFVTMIAFLAAAVGGP